MGEPAIDDDDEPLWASQAWMLHAACAGRTRLFFAPLAERPQSRVRREAKARAVCASCPVLVECRAFAREHGEFGFWGGESEDERAADGCDVPAAVGARNRRLRAAEGTRP